MRSREASGGVQARLGALISIKLKRATTAQAHKNRPHEISSSDAKSNSPSQTATHLIKALSPTAAVFIPAELAQLNSQHEAALNHENCIKSQLDAIQDMVVRGGPREHNYDRIEDYSRELAIKYISVVDARTQLAVVIVTKF